jgi:4-amino-4-deoxy-L-arabinose transferase-like glycosyltransferase
MYLHTTPIADFWTFGFEPSHIAAALVRGFGFSSPFTEHSGPTAWIPPAYPWIIAAAFKVFGIFSPNALKCMLALNLVCATLTTAVIYRIGLRCFSAEAAFGGAFLWAASPDAVAMSVRIWDIGPATLLGSLVVLCFLRAVQRQARLRDWIIYGSLWGIAALVSTTLLAMMPLAMIVLFLLDRGRMRRQAAFALGIAILIMAPWTVRNYVELGRLIPIRGNFGAELWAGNHPGVQGPADENLHPLKNKDELNAYLTMGESRYVADCQRKAMSFIRANPKQFAVLTGARIVSFWTAPLVMTSAWPIGCSVLAWASMIYLLARRETRLIAVPFAAAMFFFPFSYYISHAESYFRSPIEPLISLLTAYGFFTCLEAVSARGAASKASSLPNI